MIPRPYALLTELTYRCPLHCPYCSNPMATAAGAELSVSEWQRVFGEAAELGVLQAGLSGGEPLVRREYAQVGVRANRYRLPSELPYGDQRRVELGDVEL